VLVQSGLDTVNSRSYGQAGYVRTVLHHYSFGCQQCGCAVKYCYSFAVLECCLLLVVGSECPLLVFVIVTPFG